MFVLLNKKMYICKKIINMDELNKDLISIIIDKKLIMSKYLKNGIIGEELTTILHNFESKKDNFLKDCDEHDFNFSLKKHKDFILSVLMDMERYHYYKMRNNIISDFQILLNDKHKKIHSTWEKIEKIIYN